MDSDVPLPSAPLFNRTNNTNLNARGSQNQNGNSTNSRSSNGGGRARKYAPLSSLERFGSIDSPSSDPPLFSSDDFQSSALENYRPGLRKRDARGDNVDVGDGDGNGDGVDDDGETEGIVRKRRYRGTWWGEKIQHNKKMKKKRTDFKTKRNVDSGVWLGSDERDESASSFIFGSDDSAMFLDRSNQEANNGYGYGQGNWNGNGNGNGDGNGIWNINPPPPHAIGTRPGGAWSSTFNDTHIPSAPVDERPAAAVGPRNQVTKINKVMESEAHRLARAHINRCLEEGDDNVDLSYFNMETIPPDLLRPLAQLTRSPRIGEDHRFHLTDESFGPLEPFLRLFLTRNILTVLPKEVFDLHGLKVLSLRHNKLTEIPPAIGKLSLLQDLNVAGNRLQHLPWEILNLIRDGELKQLTVHPNRFIDIDEYEIASWHCDVEESRIRELEVIGDGDSTVPTTSTTSATNENAIGNGHGHGNGRDEHDVNNYNNSNYLRKLRARTYSAQSPPEEAWKPLLVAKSVLEHFDGEGKPISPSPSSSSSLLSSLRKDYTNQPPPSRVPSLREVALQACIRSPHLPRFLEEELEGEVSSETHHHHAHAHAHTHAHTHTHTSTHTYTDPILRLLLKAKQVRDTGEKRCSICNRAFVIDRVRWIEWWDCIPFENGSKSPRKSGQNLYPLPFLRRGCSWGCLP